MITIENVILNNPLHSAYAKRIETINVTLTSATLCNGPFFVALESLTSTLQIANVGHNKRLKDVRISLFQIRLMHNKTCNDEEVHSKSYLGGQVWLNTMYTESLSGIDNKEAFLASRPLLEKKINTFSVFFSH